MAQRYPKKINFLLAHLHWKKKRMLLQLFITIYNSYSTYINYLSAYWKKEINSWLKINCSQQFCTAELKY